MKGDKKFDQSQLSEYAEKHLAHEVEMLRWTGSFLTAFHKASFSSETIEGKISTALRESSLISFAMHSRNLIDFLYLRNYYHKDRSNDIIVEDYIDNDIITNTLIPITDLLKGAKIKADKLVAHFSMERETFGFYDKSWMYSQIAVDIIEALQSVVHEIPDYLQSDRFKRSISESLPLFFDITLRQFSKDDVRGPGLAMEFGMWYEPTEFEHD